MKDIKLEDVLPITSRQYFAAFIETPDAKFQYLLSKGHSDIQVGDWEPCGTGVFERVSNFSSNLSNNALVKKLTGSVSLKVQETQRYYFQNQDDLHVESTMIFGGSSIAESFSSRVEWVVRTLPNSHSEVRCSVKTEYKGFMFKGLIEKYVHQAACDSFHHWLKAVREKISEMQESTEDTTSTTESRGEDEDQQLPRPIYSPPTVQTPADSEDEGDDDQFYDSLEMPVPTHPTTTPASRLSPTPSTSSSAFSYAPNTFAGHNSHTQAIYASYNAGRLQQTQQQQKSNSLSSLSSLTLTRQQLTTKEVKEKYKKQLEVLRVQHKEKEKEWEEKLVSLGAKIDSLARNQKRFLTVVIVFLSLFWPVLARKLWKFLQWLWPVFRRRVGN